MAVRQGPRLRPSLRATVAMLLLGIAGYCLFTRTLVGVVAAILMAILVGLAGRAGHRPIRLIHNALGVAWTHPERGNGSIRYRDVGALIIREDWGGAELAVYLVPKTQSQSHAGRLHPADSFVLTVRDLAAGPEEGEAGLRAFTASVLPRLPSDVTLDRGTRHRLEQWGLAAPQPQA
jgi:hypothetical protein